MTLKEKYTYIENGLVFAVLVSLVLVAFSFQYSWGFVFITTSWALILGCLISNNNEKLAFIENEETERIIKKAIDDMKKEAEAAVAADKAFIISVIKEHEKGDTNG